MLKQAVDGESQHVRRRRTLSSKWFRLGLKEAFFRFLGFQPVDYR
ncbi:hypothetical protein [Rhizobium ruizarguesonis]|jgi:hypothetical protein|nr:hypothetical protein [Rhizobium ruizarguesonis]WSH03079.1 hypothetical protein U8P71_09515 [Rhizobium ruizarguesonis]